MSGREDARALAATAVRDLVAKALAERDEWWVDRLQADDVLRAAMKAVAGNHGADPADIMPMGRRLLSDDCSASLAAAVGVIQEGP